MDDSEKIINKINKLLIDLQSDIPKKIKSFNNESNLFHIVSMDNFEIKHSNFLGWLFDVNGSHDLKDAFFKKFMIKLIKNNSKNTKLQNLLSVILLDNWSDSVVLREYKHIDLLIHNEENKFNLIIENKIDSGEHDNQLQHYEEVIKNKYPNDEYRNIYVFLTLNGEKASRKGWFSFSHRYVVYIIQEILKESEVNPKMKMILADYVNILKEQTNMDKTEKERIATEIWKKNKEALEFINEYRIDPLDEIVKQFKIACNDSENIIFDEKYCTDSTHYIRFKTKGMNDYINEKQIDGKKKIWENVKYFYEIAINYNNRGITLGQLTFNTPECDENDLNKIDKITGKENGPKYSRFVKKGFKFSNMQQDFYDGLDSFDSDDIRDQCEEFLKEMVSQINTLEKKY